MLRPAIMSNTVSYYSLEWQDTTIHETAETTTVR